MEVFKDAYHTNIRQTRDHRSKKIHVTITIEASSCDMELDTVSSLTTVSWTTIRKAVLGIRRKNLKPQRLNLRDYQGNRIPVLGCDTMQVSFKDFKGPLELTVVSGSLPSLLGLD